MSQDESNDDVSIPRNRVRAELLPFLKARFNPSIVDVLADQAELARDENTSVAADGPVAGSSAGWAVAPPRRAPAEEPPPCARHAWFRRAMTGALRGRERSRFVDVERVLAMAANRRPSMAQASGWNAFGGCRLNG